MAGWSSYRTPANPVYRRLECPRELQAGNLPERDQFRPLNPSPHSCRRLLRGSHGPLCYGGADAPPKLYPVCCQPALRRPRWPRTRRRRTRRTRKGSSARPRRDRGPGTGTADRGHVEPANGLSQASPHSATPPAGLVDKSGRQAASWWTSRLCESLRTFILNLARRGRHSQSSRTGEQSRGRYRETGPTTARPPATDPAACRRSRAIAVAGVPVGGQPVPLGASLPAADLRTHARRLLASTGRPNAWPVRWRACGPGLCKPRGAARKRPDALLRSGDVELQRQRLAGGTPGAPGPPHCDPVGGR